MPERWYVLDLPGDPPIIRPRKVHGLAVLAGPFGTWDEAATWLDDPRG